MARPRALLVDLDGTLIRGNSYHALLRFLASHPGSPGTYARLAAAVFLRAVGSSDRTAMKMSVQRVARDSFDGAAGRLRRVRFVHRVIADVDPDVAAILDLAKRERLVTVLTTAAIPDYAAGVGAALGFDHVLATSEVGARDWTENLGDRKRDRTLGLIHDLGIEASACVLLTDHADDLPLARHIDATFWVVGSSGAANLGVPFSADAVRELLTSE